MKKETQIVSSSGDVFADLGFDGAEAQVLAMRADLMIELEKTLQSKKLTQIAAAKLLGVSQGRISDLVRHKTQKFSLDMLVTFAAKLGRPVKLTISASKEKQLRPAADLRA